MSKADESAFPSYEFEVLENVGIKVHSGGGLTKREIFAAMALQGLLSDTRIADGFSDIKKFKEHLAEASVGYADALLAELAKGKE